MATVSGIFTFALPDDTNSDRLRIYSSATETGSYTLTTTLVYTYGYRTQEYDSLDNNRWYKIQFYNSVDDEAGPLSSPIYGGDFGDRDTPFLALSSSFDGANYAGATDVYNRTGLSSSDISVSKMQAILRSTRAYIDLMYEGLNMSKFSRYWNSSISRRKFNATLRVIQEIEINLAAAVAYRSLADDTQMSIFRDSETDISSVTIGSTSITRSTKDRDLQIFMDLANRYAVVAESYYNTIKPASVPISYSDMYIPGHKFLHPAESVGNIYMTVNSVGDSFVMYTADLTGLGDDINGASYALNGNCVVEGVAAQSVDPVEAQSAITDSYMTVNGATYHLDDWVDNAGVTQPGKDGSTGGTDGFSIDFSASTSYVKLIWNNTNANGGFDLVDTDEVIYKYWVLGAI